ncbi:MAG TPA: LuxR C-terminal-related transcriptional regulator [Solirubrobacterales bacterium]|nr:LuxR C-terminal-related transcriptional regulator [Solirubrobacterales bacterium]
MVTGAPTVLLGRQREREVLDRMLEAAREGHGGVLAVYGEPGVGKTALLGYAVETAPDFGVVRAVGVEGETELAFAALQQLCSPTLDRLDRLPEPQRAALEVALGLSAGRPPNSFLVGLAVLNLLSEAAEDQPLLCIVDDAQWLDRASAGVLAFVTRRLLAERVAMVLAAREPIGLLRGVAELHLQPLGHRDARALLDSVLPAKLDERVLERIVVETNGNPLALLELPRGLSPAQLAGGFGLPAALPLSARIEESFARRLARLPRDARRLLLVAAADPTGDAALEWRAAARLGIAESAAHTAESDGLLAFDAGVAFRHPLVRSAVYRAAGPEERSQVHRALADATDPAIDPDRRAWHLAQAAARPDEEVAAELERSAARAQGRGGFAAAAAFLERAAALTPDAAQRTARALAAAEAKQQAGALDDALALVADAEAGPLDDAQQAQVDVIRARVSFAADRGNDAPPLLLAAAKRLEPIDAAAARELYLDALTAALFAGRLGGEVDARQVAAAARGAPPPEAPAHAADLLLEGLALLITDGAAAGTPALRQALKAFGSDDIGTEEALRWLWLAGRAAGYVWDYENWDALTERQVRIGRDSGALSVLPLTLSTRAGVELYAGNLADASSLIAEANAITDATDGRNVPYAPLAYAVFRGREPDASRLIQTTTDDFLARGEGMGLTLAQWATAYLHNGLARYDSALAAAEQAAEDPRELWFSPWTMVELVEAAVRTGNTERAARALEVLRETTQASGTPWARGLEARAAALLADRQAAEVLYCEAIEHLAPTRLRVDLARTHLLYGEWLRRERRRTDARAELKTAHDLFSEFGMEAYAERARVELGATGARARKRTVETRDDLTPQEAQISRLVAQGHTNREIAAQLFISPNTVEYHLRKVFRKLDVKSRTQLASRLRS